LNPSCPPVKRLGRPRETDLGAVVDAMLYIVLTGCQWRLLPKDSPPFTTVQGYFYDWRDRNLFERINFELLLQTREAAANPVPLLASSTANRSRPPKTADHEGMMRPKKSKAAIAML
jgi:transposase